jgi:acyl-CoA synthetase (AMP-forming)/AMP-acid ligase II/alkylation response protein AidB-like acyl-CoA dehydrogenase/acyl carrier protein
MDQFFNLVELLKYRGEKQAEQTAYIFLEDGENECSRLTYGKLLQEAQIIAAYLQASGLVGERALLLYPPGLDYITAFLGCVMASVTAVPAYPPRPNQNLRRLQAIVSDARAQAILSTVSLSEKIKGKLDREEDSGNLLYITTDAIPLDQTHSWKEPEIDEESLVFLQYTSGSTGQPKGVMVSHRNLLHNQQIIQQGFDHTAGQSSVVGWLPLFHDMGLIGNVLQPLYVGIPCVLMSPVAFLQKPIRWLQAISRYRATTSGGPNSAYEICVRRITEEQKRTLDLSCWQRAFNGAEPVRAETLKRFAAAFADCGFRSEAFYPCYGMAETTLMVSGGRSHRPPLLQDVDSAALEQNQLVSAKAGAEAIRTLVSCGQPLTGMSVVIVNPETLCRCRMEEVGEIWVTGASVTQGYWNQPEATAAAYAGFLQDTGEGPFLRTGDLGCLQGEELFITGRLKDLIVIRGRNHYPQDIELSVAQAHPALRPNENAVFAIEEGEEEKLIVVQEVERTCRRQLQVDEVVGAIRRQISQEHQLQVHAISLISPGSLPKTSSGKVQRHACRQAYLTKSLKEIASWQLPLTETVASFPIVSAESRQRADAAIAWLRDYGSKRINSRLIDERRCIPPYVVLDLGNRGLLGMQIGENHGGLALNNTDTLRVMQQLAAIDLTLASFLGVNNALGTRPILNYGQQALQDELLPLIASGRELAAYAMTEPGAGSHPQAITSTATPDGKGGWKLRGEKHWIGSGSWAGTINVFAQLLDEKGRRRGITGFLVRQGTQGLEQGPELLTMGMRGMVQNRLYLNDVPVGITDLLGQQGAGMEVAQDAMMYGRLGLGAIAVGGMKRCAQLMLRYASRRSVATGKLLDNPVTMMRLNQLSASITAVEALVSSLAQLLDRGVALPEEAYIACKTSGPEFLWQATDGLMQLLGGRGYIETNIAPQLLRDARLLRIFEGPTEALHLFLGSRVINQPQPLEQFLAEQLKAPSVVEELRKAVQQLQEFASSPQAPFPDKTASMRWAYSVAGELATLAVLQGAIDGVKSRPASWERSLNWLKWRFDIRLQEALALRLQPWRMTNASGMAAEIASYADTIGDLDQTLAGEEVQLDELLRLDSHAEQRETLRPELNVPVTQLKSFTDQSHVSSIQEWIVNWISKNLKVPSASILASQSFSEYGMDSIMAVEFAQDLASWLKCPVEPTVVWNYSTIGILAQYLAESSMSQQMANAPQSPGGPSGFPDESSDLGTQFISSKNSDLPSAEEEIASLLATELLQVKQSIKNVKHKIKRAIRHPHI